MTKIFKEEMNSPKVFISYSYDSKAHELWVQKLANDLREKAGVNAIIDKFVLNDTINLDQIMISGFRDSDKVIIIATREYAKRANSETGGVGFESKLATVIARDSSMNDKLIFIKKDEIDNFKEVFPYQFSDYYAIDFSKDDDYEEKFRELYHKIWGKSQIKISPIGDSPFDGVGDPDRENNLVYSVNNETVFNILEKSGFEPFSLNRSDFSKDAIIIWPVVPRQKVNLIHYSQIEVIRVLSLLGWETKIIIANCGNSDVTPSRADVEFVEKLEHYLVKKGINNYEISNLNSYFSPDFVDGNKILAHFVKISSALKISQLSRFNTKDNSYDENAQAKINDRTTLKYISPLFTWSASIYEAEKYFADNDNTKAIIIAGRDEESQWSHVIAEIDSHIGAIFIPILKQEDFKTVYQAEKPLLFSKSQLERELGKGNLDKWLFQSFTNLAEFPNIVHSLPFCNNKDENCNSKFDGNKCLECIFPNDSDKLPDHIDKKKFVDSIYSKIEPI